MPHVSHNLEITEYISCMICSSFVGLDPERMNCISRKDKKDNNLFQREKKIKPRWNLYTQIAISNNSLICKYETYALTEICSYSSTLLPCTLQITNEVVNIGCEIYST